LNKKKLDHQTGLRVLERLVIQRAYDFVKTDVRTVTKDRPPPDPLLNGSKATFRFETDPGRGPDVIQVEYTWHSQCNFGAVPMYQAEIAALLLSELFPEYAGGVPTGGGVSPPSLAVPWFTEYERNGFVYRAHPRYRGESAYYDWALVQWVVGNHPETNAEMHASYPARLLGFFRHPAGDVRAIVHSVKEKRGDQSHGVFSTHWMLERQGPASAPRPLLRMVSVDTLLEHVCVIPFCDADPFHWFHMWHPRTWADCFKPDDRRA
jgi:hypothetical protein